MSLESLFNRAWYENGCWTNVFRPLQPLVRKLVKQKRDHFLAYPETAYRASVPVIVVGNISIGGTGKSPMVVALCQLLMAQGYRPGIVSRGHGVKVSTPTAVYADSLASEVGDEPVMLARRSACPLVIFPKRDLAAQHLLATTDVNVIISDDGMQHYQLNRDIEIAMLDAKRGLGNGYLLPVGPLREPVERLSEVDFIVSISDTLTDSLEAINLPVTLAPLESAQLISLDGHRCIDCADAFSDTGKWHILAGIGNPQRFVETLEKLGLHKDKMSCKWFSDHHAFESSDIPANGNVIMTEKDAVKCQALNLSNPNIWYLPVSLVLPNTFQHDFLAKLNLITVDDHHE